MNVLFITATRIGDAILSTTVLAHVLAEEPDARVMVACGPAAAPLFAETPCVTEIHVMRKAPRAGHWWALWRRAVPTVWDLVIDLRGSAIAWTLMAKARWVAGKGTQTEHRLQQLARLVGRTEPLSPRLFVSDRTRQKAQSLIPLDRPFLALGPTANWWGKQWPPERFEALAKHLTAPGGHLEGARIAVLGAQSERAMAAPLLEALAPEQAVDLIGQLSLLEAYALLEKAALYVGNDSGLMHLAAASGVPTLGLFGPSPEAVYAPWGPRAATIRGPRSYEDIVRAPDFDHLAPRCYMLDLEVEPVIASANRLLDRVRAEKGA